jgi:4'-phosphopantetheinyl transferase
MTFRPPRELENPLSGGQDIEIILARLDIPACDVDIAAAVLSDDERRRAQRFVFKRDRNRYVVARAQLRKLLGERLQISPESIEFCYGEYGKPALANQPTDQPLYFNVSHSDDVAVYAFSRSLEVGVDVEAITDMSDRDEVAAHCFSNHEITKYRQLDDSDKPLGFFNCWTRKEAFVKALGDGLQCPLNSFDVTLSPGEPAEILRIGEHSGRECGWKLFSFAPLPGFVGAVAIQSPT